MLSELLNQCSLPFLEEAKKRKEQISLNSISYILYNNIILFKS